MWYFLQEKRGDVWITLRRSKSRQELEADLEGSQRVIAEIELDLRCSPSIIHIKEMMAHA